MQCHVLDGSDITGDLQHLLEVDDLALLSNSNHRPRCVIEFISQSLKHLKVDNSIKNVLVRSL